MVYPGSNNTNNIAACGTLRGWESVVAMAAFAPAATSAPQGYV